MSDGQWLDEYIYRVNFLQVKYKIVFIVVVVVVVWYGETETVSCHYCVGPRDDSWIVLIKSSSLYFDRPANIWTEYHPKWHAKN